MKKGKKKTPPATTTVKLRRISQVFFFVLFLWLCIVNTVGTAFWQLRGWPVNWFLELDPLVGLATVLSTGTLYKGLLWGLLSLLLTLLFGRWFCGWLCPYGAIHQFVGWLGRRKRRRIDRIAMNRFRKAHHTKYYILVVLLTMAAGGMIPHLPFAGSLRAWTAASLQTGLLDPIPMVTRSFTLVLLPIADRGSQLLSVAPRYTIGAGLLAGVFLTFVLLNLVIPRFYCRYICPLGALFGWLSRWSLWRIGKIHSKCADCDLCVTDCEGACEPEKAIRWSECLLCMNCTGGCPDRELHYSTALSEAGEVPSPQLTRRGFLGAVATGAVVAPSLRLAGGTTSQWNPDVIRPPGTLDETGFLSRCIKCGQCMRVCPTNIIQPTLLESGLEGLWTPKLDYRIGTSGCQLNCVACGHACPTGAIRPITLDEKHGTGAFEGNEPIRVGTAFVDRGRCLPWAMDRPCIVCEENCPVSPKAIGTEALYKTVQHGTARVTMLDGPRLRLDHGSWAPGELATGDYYLASGDTGGRVAAVDHGADGDYGDEEDSGADGAAPSMSPTGPRRIIWNSGNLVKLEQDAAALGFTKGLEVNIQVYLLRPVVNPALCIGCGVCEHECPVSGRRAIRVTAENETRNREHRLLL